MSVVRKILVCTDGSDGAIRATKYAAELANALKAEVVLASIFNPPVGAQLWSHQPLPMCVTDVLDTGQTVEAALTDASATILRDALVSYRTHVETGDPVHLILDIAKREEADLLVVGSRGLGGFSSLLLGSVSDSLAHHAPCPVLIVR